MISRSHRVSVEQFNMVLEKGRVAHSPLFLVRFLKGMADVRVAAVTPKKVAKTATARNSMRRKIYEAVGPLKNSLTPGTHILIFAKPALVPLSRTEIAPALKTLFVQAGILR